MHSARWYGSQSWLVAVWPLLPMLAVLAFGTAAIVFWRIASAQPKVSGYARMAANSSGSILFATVHVGGIPRSMDGRRTWQPTIEINSDVHEVRAHQVDPGIVVAASAIGLCISHDGGTTWTIERDGLHASYCSAVAFSGDDILVAASTDHFATKEEFIVGRSDGMETQWPSKTACLRGSTVSPTQVASPQTAQRLCWLTEPAPCTYQLSAG